MKYTMYLLLTMALVISGCSSTDKTSDIKNFKYNIGVTKRNDVIEVLGLPDVVAINKADGSHVLGYQGEADGSDLFIPIPIAAAPVSSDMMQVFFGDIGPAKQSELKKADIIFVFDKNDTLTTVTKPAK